jgi:hypothetical protein
MTQKQRFALYLPAELRCQIDRWYTSDESTSINEFIIKAIQFYLSHLAANEDNPLLPTAISSAIEGRLGVFEDRMAKLLFKQAVEMAMLESILASQLELGKSDLDQLRSWCVDTVKRTNGRLNFRDVTTHI